MAKDGCKFWGISSFPVELKNAFKGKCALENVEMVVKLEELIENYVYNKGNGIGEASLSDDERMVLIKLINKGEKDERV